MPFKDPEKRREYNRNYKRRQRGLTNPGKPLDRFKVYLCFQYPQLRLKCYEMGREIFFHNGFVVTDRPEEQAIIEGHEYFGRHIWLLTLGGL